MGRFATPLVVIGTVGAAAGGFVPTVSASSPSYKASWVVAYVVLVAGMGQVALGLAQEWLAEGQPSPGLVAIEAISFNVANIAILVGTLMISTVLVDAGGGLFIIALAIFLWGYEPLPARTNGYCTGFGF